MTRSQTDDVCPWAFYSRSLMQTYEMNRALGHLCAHIG